ncbi:MAG: SUMF1/EgtB/PvdO family nonheme iron enzyme [Myxococcota bacterium]|nr:SUMF1/EgtB/PvdO family nonheme iron enzyme [Myxococcota bacterium]
MTFFFVLLLCLSCQPRVQQAVSPCPSDMGYIAPINHQVSWGEIQPNQSWHLPEQQRRLSPFCMDRYEYPNQSGVIPLSNVTWEEANRICSSHQKRLCTEEEWSLACRGAEKRSYSYGTVRKSGICNTEIQRSDSMVKSAPSGSFADCRTPEGIFDLNGNVSEWVVNDWRAFDHNQKRWKKRKAGYKTLRGGTMWKQTHYGQDCTSRHGHHRSDWQNHDDGFRCCLSISASLP